MKVQCWRPAHPRPFRVYHYDEAFLTIVSLRWLMIRINW